jgi:hypothetical protein
VRANEVGVGVVGWVGDGRARHQRVQPHKLGALADERAHSIWTVDRPAQVAKRGRRAGSNAVGYRSARARVAQPNQQHAAVQAASAAIPSYAALGALTLIPAGSSTFCSTRRRPSGVMCLGSLPMNSVHLSPACSVRQAWP